MRFTLAAQALLGPGAAEAERAVAFAAPCDQHAVRALAQCVLHERRWKLTSTQETCSCGIGCLEWAHVGRMVAPEHHDLDLASKACDLKLDAAAQLPNRKLRHIDAADQFSGAAKRGGRWARPGTDAATRAQVRIH